MRSQIQVYAPSVTVEENPHNADLLALNLNEDGAEAHVVARRATWQQVADQLAALGVVATPAEPTAEFYKCRHCGAEFGIAGVSSGSDDDLATEDYFDDEVRRHESGECVNAEVTA